MNTDGEKLLYQAPDWFVYNLPDALWSFSFTYLVLLVWGFKISKTNCLWIFSVPLICMGYEIGQFFGIIKGTYDNIDLIFIIIAIVLSFYPLIFKLFKSNSNEKIKQKN
jgi:hypothetical protein